MEDTEEVTTEHDVNLMIDDDLAQGKTDQKDEGATDVDDLLNKSDVEIKKTDEGAEKKETDKPADKGEVKVEDELKVLRQELDSLKTDKKNLQKALHGERQKLKERTKKESDVELTDEHLENIIRENTDPVTGVTDPKILLRVTRYMAERIARGEKDKAISEVDVSQKSRAVNNLLLERYPQLAEESSEMRIEIDQVKESLGLKDNPFGDAFAVGVRVVEKLPTILTNAYERGKKDALGVIAEEKRGDGIADSKLTPKGDGKSSSKDSGLTKEHLESANSLDLTASQKKIYAKLVGKNPRTVSVED
jgi:hypothetical protein